MYEHNDDRKFSDLTWTEAALVLGDVFGLYVKFMFYSIDSWNGYAQSIDKDGEWISVSKCGLGIQPYIASKGDTLEDAARGLIKQMFKTKWPASRKLGDAYMEFPNIGEFESLAELELLLAATGITDYYFNRPSVLRD